MDAREPYAIQIQFLAMRFTSIVVNSRLKSCSVSLSLSLLKTSLFATRSVYIQADQKLAILLFLLFILSLYGQIRWRNERENGFGKKNPASGRACCDSVVFPSCFFFISSSSVTLFRPFCDIHGPGIILSSIYTFVRFVSCDDTGWRGRKEKTGRVHRMAFSVGERDDRLWTVLLDIILFYRM